MRFIYLSSADGNKKLFDSRLQMGALPRQRACGLQNLRRCSAGLNGAFANVGDVGRNFRSPGRGLTDIGGNLSSMTPCFPGSSKQVGLAVTIHSHRPGLQHG
jgi:hypothetical protein